MTLNEAYRILGLDRSAAPAQVKAAYRRLVADAHPDRGGEAAEFIRIRAAYEIVSTFLKQGVPEDDIAIPADLRAVIDSIVWDFRENQRWAEAEALRQMGVFETRMDEYIRNASRAELRQFTSVFRSSWNAIVNALFTKCNTRCDEILQSYESWYSESTQVVFDDLYRKEVLHFPFRRRFWEIFVLIVALAGAVTVMVGWGGPVDRWISVAIVVVAAVVSFLIYRWWCQRRRQEREKVEPLAVVPFQLQEDAQFQTEQRMRRGRRTTGALGLAGMFLGSAAAGGFALPIVGAVAGATVGGVFDRLINPTGRMREGMRDELRKFMAIARPEVTAYVLEVHQSLMDDVQVKIVENYQARVRDTVRLLTAGDGPAAPIADKRRGQEDPAV